jgi:hypothetical protein
MRNGSGARADVGTECWPQGQMRRLRGLCGSLRRCSGQGFVTRDRPLFNPVEWKMG